MSWQYDYVMDLQVQSSGRHEYHGSAETTGEANIIKLKCVQIMYTFVCISASTAIQDRHFLNAEVRDLYPPIKFAAGLSAEIMVSVPLM